VQIREGGKGKKRRNMGYAARFAQRSKTSAACLTLHTCASDPIKSSALVLHHHRGGGGVASPYS